MLLADVKYYWPWSETRKSLLFANVKLARVCYWQIRNVIGHWVKLLNSLLFASVKCCWPHSQTHKSSFLQEFAICKCGVWLASEWNSLRVCYLQMWNVIGHGVKPCESLVFVNGGMLLTTKWNSWRVCYLQMWMLLATEWNSIRAGYLQMWKVVGHGSQPL